MAIYQPVNVWPTTKAIDVFKDNTFSVEMNTNDSVIAYQLTILDWDNKVVLAGEKVVLDEPLYNGDFLYFDPVLKDKLKNGNDYKWRLRLFQESTSMVITSGYVVKSESNTVTISRNTNIKVGMYLQVNGQRKKITKIEEIIPETISTTATYKLTLESAFSGDVVDKIYDVYSDFIDTTPDFVLYARTTPVVTITNFANEIHARNYTFKGSYTQQENVPMTYYQIVLSILQNNVARVIYDTGKVYRADIKLEYDGYIQGNTYQLELIVQNESNVSVTTGVKVFKVQYDTVEFLTEPQLSLDCKKHAIKINWTTPIDFEGVPYNVGQSYQGTVANMAGNTIQIQPNLEIPNGSIIIFDSKFENQISSYNKDTGLLVLRYALENDIVNGSPFVILNTTIGTGNLKLLLNEPYRMTNSANTLENVLSFRDAKNGYIGKTPNKDNITFQFKLPVEFWDGVLTKNMRLLPVFRLQTEENDIRGFEVFVNLNKLVFIKPALDGGKVYSTKIKSIESDTRLILTEPIDFKTQKYMKFQGYDDIIEVISYDEQKNMVVLFEKPHFSVEEGATLLVYDTLQYEFYQLLSYFPLQEQGTWNATYDYIWDDTKEWDDSLYWYEGGGAKQRISNTWFKARIVNQDFDVRAGGV